MAAGAMWCLADMREHGLTDSGIQGLGLFQAQRQQRRGFPAFALSTVVHTGGIFAISYVLLHAPVIKDPSASQYKVRELELHQPETAASRAAEEMYPTPHPAQPKDRKGASADHTAKQSALQKAEAALPVSLPKGGQGKQTLIQPDVPTKQAMAQAAPLPAVLIWTPAVRETLHLKPPVRDSVTTTDAETSLAVPNEELQLAKLPQQSVDRPTNLPTPPAGSTTPVAVKQPSEVKMAPATVSATNEKPASAAVLSLSDLKLKDGTVVLPPVNEFKGADQKQGAEQTPSSAAAKVLGTGGSAQQGGATLADAQKQASDGAASGESAERIQLPPNGRFGVVVVGTSLADQYPQTLQIWSDRVAYTAYLHVGTPKAWILQYAQLRNADAASGGTVAHLEAPWPYDIVRPNLLSKDLNADALMIHGVLNQAGRLENLAIAYPDGYAHASFVLRELAKWQFRPAQQLGKATPVEVLLIIPQDED
jgi:hypothetical protein